MAIFLDLPLEILPLVLQHIARPSHLVLVCLTCRSLHTFAVPLLYERVFVFAWHRNSKRRVAELFRTLSDTPYLARYVQLLEMRDFPKALSTSAEDDMLDVCLRGLKNCNNLQSCSWTRDGAFSAPIISALQSRTQLRCLEFNGHHNGYYDPESLLSFTTLSKISMIMPSGPVIDILPRWTATTSSMLRSLTLICKMSPLVTDELLESLAPNLVNLEYLHLVGCSKVTERGIWSIVSSNTRGIRGLGLEGLSTRFNLADLANNCTGSHSSPLARLESMTLTIQPHNVDNLQKWSMAVLALLAGSPVKRLQLYSSGPTFEARIPNDFWARLIEAHGHRLIRLSVHRMHISTEAIHHICKTCPRLEELFVVADKGDLRSLANAFGCASQLRTIHVNFPLTGSTQVDEDEDFTDTVPVLREDDALALVEKCGSSLTQFGCNSRVWQVGRIAVVEGDEVHIVKRLMPYESPDVPEQFLVVRA